MTKFLEVKPGWNPIIDEVQNRVVDKDKKKCIDTFSIPFKQGGRKG